MHNESMSEPTPKHLDLKKDTALTITWDDGRTSVYPIEYLRRLSPSADMRELRKQQQRNPLTVLPTKFAEHQGPLTALDAELLGNYAIRITFSDGHNTGIYSWQYLRQIDPGQSDDQAPAPDQTPAPKDKPEPSEDRAAPYRL